MEMVGVIAFIHALMGYIARHYGEVRIGFDRVGATAVDAAEPTAELPSQASHPFGASVPGTTLLRD
jgi:hypothetical protein